MSKTQNCFSPKNEPVCRKPKIFAAFQNLLNQVCGDLGRQSVEGELQVVVRVPMVAEDAGELAYQTISEMPFSFWSSKCAFICGRKLVKMRHL
ncbi:hypothetical protein ACFX11_030074 [Malus domestica]